MPINTPTTQGRLTAMIRGMGGVRAPAGVPFVKTIDHWPLFHPSVNLGSSRLQDVTAVMNRRLKLWDGLCIAVAVTMRSAIGVPGP